MLCDHVRSWAISPVTGHIRCPWKYLRRARIRPRLSGSQEFMVRDRTCLSAEIITRNLKDVANHEPGHERPHPVSPDPRKLSLWQYSSHIRLSLLRASDVVPRLWLRPVHQAWGGLDLASGWPVPSADCRRLNGNAISVRDEDRGFSCLPRMRRNSNCHMHDRGDSICRAQRKFVRRSGPIAVRRHGHEF